MKILHVFAGPYPTVQGTQALVGQTCRALAEAGHEVHLLCYAHSSFERNEPFTIHRIPDRPSFSNARSGPAWQKLVLDIRIAAATGSLQWQYCFDIIHAHHYEALLACRLADPLARVSLVFHLHALFEPELPTYFPARWKKAASCAGRILDRVAPSLADSFATVTRSAEYGLLSRTSKPVVYVPPAFRPVLPLETRPPVSTDNLNIIYVGNLDEYQGLEALLDGVSQVGKRVRKKINVTIATDSSSEKLLRELHSRRLLDVVSVVPHGSPENAWKRLAGSDITVIPRYLPGGVPIKLINAFILGIPALVDDHLTAEYEHGDSIWAVTMTNSAKVATEIERLVEILCFEENSR